VSAKPRPPQRRRGDRKHDLPEVQPGAEPNINRLADHRCPRSTCHQAPHHRRGRGAFEHVTTHRAPPDRVRCPSSASVRAPRSNCRRRSRGAPRRESQRLKRRLLLSSRGMICHIFSDYREYPYDEEVPEAAVSNRSKQPRYSITRSPDRRGQAASSGSRCREPSPSRD
jgi:hypothetical protein